MASSHHGEYDAAKTDLCERVLVTLRVAGLLSFIVLKTLETPEHDGPSAYASFLADSDDDAGKARLRNEAVVVVQQFIAALGD